jgi:DNA-directed RNA polymerase specialized sigma54-like protein
MMQQVLRQELRMILTPQLLMNLKLLQMPTLELEQMLQQELEANPVLEELTDDADADAVTLETAAETPDAPEPEETPPQTEDLLNTSEAEKLSEEKPEIQDLDGALDKGDIALADFLQDDSYLPPEPVSTAPEDREMLEAVADETACVADIFLPMVKSRVDEADYPIAELIIDRKSVV